MVLERYVGKRINKIFAAYPANKTSPSFSINDLELGELVDIQTLLQQRKKMRLALLGIYKFIGNPPVEI
jgi:hypothetical protein